MARGIGELLNRDWRIGAQQARYHKDGTWYHQLRKFPGALCDPNGYVVFRTEAEFRSCPNLRIDQDVNVSGHISQLPGYVRVPSEQRYNVAASGVTELTFGLQGGLQGTLKANIQQLETGLAVADGGMERTTDSGRVDITARDQRGRTVAMTKTKKSASQFARYIGPVLQAIRELGGSGRPDEVRTVIARSLCISDAEQSEPLPSGVQTRFENQVHWARFYLAKAGYIDSSQRGVWTLTEKGRSLGEVTPDEIQRLIREVAEQTKPASGGTAEPAPGAGEIVPLVTDYREELARTLQSLPAGGFERFCQRLLRESGFQEVTITGRSGDGGIDGIGILQVNALVSFKVLFQCKKYAGSVTPSHVRDFRGAMTGRADKGIIITTGSFTSEARKEAIRDGAPPIELVDGEKLAGMLEKLELGLRPRQTFEMDTRFFEEYKK